MAPTTLTDLPPELLDHIITYLPTAKCISSLGRTSRTLRAIAEKDDVWQIFSRTRFPSLCPQNLGSGLGYQHVARSLTTLSRAIDRRAFISRYIEPLGDIRAFPGDKRSERWKRPRGQTIGFMPQLDSFEDSSRPLGERKEVLAFSAGAGICLRERRITNDAGSQAAKWITYRPLAAVEGRDDVTCMHLLRQEEGDNQHDSRTLIVGTANGDLQLLKLPPPNGSPVQATYFTTQGRDVRSTGLLQAAFKPTLLTANLGKSHLALYSINPDVETIVPSSEIDVRPQMASGRRGQRIWSTEFLSASNIAVGLGPSEEPLHIYTITPSGMMKEPSRKFALQDNCEKKRASSIYPIVPLPPASSSAAGNGDGDIFLSGAYDGVVRLHDLRSPRNVIQIYSDPTEDGSIYSLLPRGRETFIAGTSRHSLLKVFDLRLGSKAYNYMDADSPAPTDESSERKTMDWSLFLKPHTATYPGRGGGNNWARRSAESSIYSLTSPSPTSPYVFAGVENAVVEMAFTSLLDHHPDPTYFKPLRSKQVLNKDTVGGMRSNEILDLAMYNQNADMKLHTQRSVWDTCRLHEFLNQGNPGLEGLDERWKIGS